MGTAYIYVCKRERGAEVEAEWRPADPNACNFKGLDLLPMKLKIVPLVA